ncbi:MAG: hypothetical protein FWH18_05220 [Marinilabiliaceae bacterium]|nr:hypothetical protein [Marinilabiliaceae bacterium]
MKIETGLKSSTFKLVPKDTHKYNDWRDNRITSCYQDENGVLSIFSGNHDRYFNMIYNGLTMIWDGAPLKIGVKETLKLASEFLMKYDITQLTVENHGEQKHIYHAILDFKRSIEK